MMKGKKKAADGRTPSVFAIYKENQREHLGYSASKSSAKRKARARDRTGDLAHLCLGCYPKRESYH